MTAPPIHHTHQRPVKGGLEVRHDGYGWDVVHVSSGLKAVMDLRLRRFAVQARQELLDTGVDFTADRDSVQQARRDWQKVYNVWWERARRRSLDPETFEWYASYVPYGTQIPTERQAAMMRENRANVDRFYRGELRP